MSKRAAESQLTKDDYEAEQEEQMTGDNTGTWKPADEEVLKTRQIIKARRPAQTAAKEQAPAALPKFSFGGAAATTPSTTAESSNTSTTTSTAPSTTTSTTAESSPAPTRTLADIFASQASQGWECPVCEVRNKFSLAKCGACDGPRPAEFDKHDETAKPAQDKQDDALKFTFGGVAPTSTSSASTTSTAPTVSTFSFGSSTNSATPFTFGKPVTGDGAGSLFNPFAAVAASSADASKATFSFGTPADKSSLASFQSVASTSETKSDFSGSDAPHFPSTSALEASAGPNDEFKGKQAEGSGEENDEIQHRQQCKVFAMKVVSEANSSEEKSEDAKPAKATTAEQPKWVEIGVGELHVNIYKGTNNKKMARLIMRTDKTHRLVLNTPLVPSLAHSFTLQGDKYVKIASIDPETTKLVQYLFKVATKQEATTLLEQFTAVTGKVVE